MHCLPRGTPLLMPPHPVGKVFFCIALVGRPNVGKSRLFNCLTHSRTSIVHDLPGVTRDVVSMELPSGATLLDTGGLGLVGGETPVELLAAIERQVDFAIAMADLVVLVLDGKAGLVSGDLAIAAALRRRGKRVLPVVNKVDGGDLEAAVADFASLGFGEGPIAVSAEHGRGIGDLEAVLFRGLEPSDGTASGEERLAMAFIGAPNVGKSSLANALLGSPRMIVSEWAGTTRDSVHGDFTFADADGREQPMRILDTAGLRAPGKVDSSVEYFSSLRARRALGSTPVIFLVLDAVRGLTEFDKKIAADVAAAGKNLAIVVNKWDLAMRAVLRDALPAYGSLQDFQTSFEEALRRELFLWPQIPILFLSARDGEGIHALGETALLLRKRSLQTITTGVLNRFICECLEEHRPANRSGKTFKIFYSLQTAEDPIAIRLYCNNQRLFTPTDESHLRRKFIERFSLGGCSLRFTFVSKPGRQREKSKNLIR